ncbi:aldo-keto reductase family 1 member B1-like [Chrysoperla carnea]|uniref:aldo-keto reductase family 1 member B1-like n=1 Tax=Chrysoperla carnea TaxID=189513 RepID=UPI001D05D9EE|nr:aldo-keto reductase family 1 member B1-like [Chrysoperla carnea]
MAAPYVKLNNGLRIPALGLGTYQANLAGECAKVVKNAIDVGYRHFDCAFIYGNEKEIGEAFQEKLKDGTVKREELYITTKLWNNCHRPDRVVDACKKSLNNFGLSYVDLYLIHWPCGYDSQEGDDIFPSKFTLSSYSFVDTWKEMEKCVKLGLTKSIGISNFNHEQIERLLKHAEIKPVVNQIEVHPNLNQKKLIAFCKERNIEIVAYSPFGAPSRPWAKPNDPVVRLDDPTFVNIGKKYGKTSAQVILRYLVDIGTIPIPKSTNKERLKLNIDIFDFKLTPDEIAIIDKYDCNGRICSAEEMKNHPEYPFNLEY